MANEEKTIDQQSYDEVADRIKDFDFDRAMKLMSIMKEVPGTAPRCTSIAGLAATELEAMNVEAQGIARARADKGRELQAEKDREAEQRRQEEQALAEKERLEQEQRERDRIEGAAANAQRRRDERDQETEAQRQEREKEPAKTRREVDPSAEPATSQTATIADRNARRL